MEATIYVQDVYNITGIGVVPVGEVKSGTLRIGMRTNANGVLGTVKTIEMHHQQLQEANAGDNIGFTIKGLGKKDLCKGMTLTFTDHGEPAMMTAEKPEPIHPKGLFSRLFRR